MNILIACDSFKDGLPALAVCQAIERGLQHCKGPFSTRIFPLADGGEGLSEILDFHLGLKKVTLQVQGPLHQPVSASYHLSHDGKIAFLEMAQAAGLQLLPPALRNPLKTNTFGVGQMIHHALDHRAERIVLGLGGSATNDLGTGMAAALGWQFLDQNGLVFTPGGGSLDEIRQIIPPKTQVPLSVEVMCDVTNPLLGPNGAAQVYARQKGADDAAIKQLEIGAAHFIQLASGLQTTHADQAGAGAAGGMGFGAQFFLQARIKRGIDAVLDLSHFDEQVAWADLILTGEGRLDSQTAQGKLIAGVVSRSAQKPVVALCGAVDASPQDLKDLGLQSAFSIAQKPCTLPEALAATAENLEKTAFQIGQLLR